MTISRKINSKLRSFKRDESGSFSMIWAVCGTVLLGTMGAALDYSLLSSSYDRAQSIADTTALSAAIYVMNNEAIPTNPTKGLIGDYTAEALGYNFKNWVIGGSGGVNINVVYDEVEREAVVTATGKTRPMLMQIFGHTELDFEAKSIVKFYEKEPLDPASIVLVLDNSGSMYFDDNPLDEDGNTPDGTQRRIDGLTSSANSFMDLLDATVGSQDGSNGLPRVLRTGMMAFATDIIPSRTVAMNWGTISDSAINNMTPDGATNSAPPLVVADNWLNINEPPVHALESPGKTPLKYIILMTDGKNTVGTEEWVAREGTENWRAWLPTHTTETVTEMVEVTVTVPAVEGTTSRQIVNSYVPGGNCAWENGYPRQRYSYTYSSGGTNTWRTSWRVVCDVTSGGTPAYETTEWEEQETEVTTTTWDWEYREQELEPLESGNWEEGEFDISSNIATREQCDSLHASNVEVFSIAYALAPGDYRTNDWGQANFSNPDFTFNTTDEDANKARSILQYCASSSENFITADNSESLEAAFERIGNTIVKEIIRISS